MTRIVEVRRHSERADRSDEESGLTERGRQMCAALSGTSYAVVASSPTKRARETAQLIAGRQPRVMAGLLPELHGLPFGFWEGVRELAGYRELVLKHAGARAIADEQAELWMALAREMSDGQRALAISHGAVVELGAVAIVERLGTTLEGPTFGLCEGVEVTYEGDRPISIEVLRSTLAGC